MKNRIELSDEEWQAIYSVLLLNPRGYVGSEDNSRRFLNAVLWILRRYTVAIIANLIRSLELGV